MSFNLLFIPMGNTRRKSHENFFAKFSLNKKNKTSIQPAKIIPAENVIEWVANKSNPTILAISPIVINMKNPTKRSKDTAATAAEVSPEALRTS